MAIDKNIEIPIMFCFDKNYVIPASVAFYSLLEHANQNYKYHFFVLHTDISDVQQKMLYETIEPFDEYVKLDFINMENRFDDIWKNVHEDNHFSKEVMYKLLVSSIFPQYDKIIITDVDVAFLGDISESYIDFDCNDDYYLAGVKQIGKINSYYMDYYKKNWSNEEIEKLCKICGGYLVVNLEKIRIDNMEEKFVDFFSNNCYRLIQMEQDILNICCYSKIKQLPLNYVVCSYMWDYFKDEESKKEDENYSFHEIDDAMENPIQLHFATSTKPWKNINCTKSEEWFKYIVKTPFLNEYLNNLATKIKLDGKKHGIIYKGFRYIKHNPTFFIKKDFYHKVFNKFKSFFYIFKKK